jgi:nicotinamidase-related amidase
VPAFKRDAIMSRTCDASRAVTILVDLQQRLMPAIHEHATVAGRALVLGQAAGCLQIPVIGTAQSPASLGGKLPEVGAVCGAIVEKTSFDACLEPSFLEALPPGRDIAVLAGCEAHVCVLQTALSLVDRMRVMVVADAIGSRVPLNKEIALQRMAAAGVEIVTTEMMVFEWLKHSRHPQFRECLRMIK